MRKSSGVVPDGHEVIKTWVHLAGQENPRPHHERMDGETVPMDQPYSNGDMYAGEGDPWGCHCTDHGYSVKQYRVVGGKLRHPRPARRKSVVG
jgi:hypothetical protein